MNRRLWLLVIICAWIVSCSRGGDTKSSRTSEDLAKLKATSDSVYEMSPKALNMIQEGLKKAKDSTAFYEYYLQLTKYYFIRSKTDSIIPQTEKIIRFANSSQPSPRLRAIKAGALETKASYFYQFYQKRDEAEKLHKKAYSLLMNSDDKGLAPDVCANLADVYQQGNKIPQASFWYRRALFLVDSLGLPPTKNVTLYMGMARIYQQLNDNEQAKYFYEKTRLYYKKLRPGMKVYFLNNYGNFYYYNMNYKRALKEFLQLKNVVERDFGANDFNRYLCYINLSDVYLNLKQLDSARYYLYKAEPFFIRNKVDVGIFYARTIRIGIALQQGDLASIKKLLLQDHGIKVSDPGITGIRSKYLQQYYAKTGDYKSAYLNLKRALQLNDSIEKNRSYMRASEIMSRFTQDTLSLHKKIALQQQSLEVKKTKNSLLLSIFITIFVVFIMVIWMFYIRKKHIQDELNVMQLRLANTRNRISPHFVFNVLNNKITHTNKGEADELMKLVKLIRTNLDVSRNNYITLKEELDFVRYYIEVESFILGDDFEFSVEAPGNDILEQIMVPSIFVQILVENAIKHGLKGLERHKSLRVIINHLDKGTEIHVIDNGRGFDIRRSSANSTKTGLNVIRQTIMLINQHNRIKKMSFRIHNNTNHEGLILGCESILYIPNHIKLI